MIIDSIFMMNHFAWNLAWTLILHVWQHKTANKCNFGVFVFHLQLYDVFPRLMKNLPGPHQTIFSNYATIIAFIKEEIEKHKEDWDPSDPRDYIDTYLGETETVRITVQPEKLDLLFMQDPPVGPQMFFMVVS